MLQKVEAGMSVLAHNKGLAFTTAISPDLPPELWGDERRLVQILINLIGNAIKFTKTGQVSIQLALTDPTHWTMQVADTGIGVPAEARAFIFEPFRQVDNALTRENRGTGLGLSIAKQLVELMGGRINLQSELGKGSTFTVWLPLMLKPEKIA
jgi:signal transduction histidine kinase